MICRCTTTRDKIDRKVVPWQGDKMTSVQLRHDYEPLSHSLVLCSVYTFCIIVPTPHEAWCVKWELYCPSWRIQLFWNVCVFSFIAFPRSLFIKKWTYQYHFINIFFCLLRFLPPHFSKTNESLLYTYSSINHVDSID